MNLWIIAAMLVGLVVLAGTFVIALTESPTEIEETTCGNACGNSCTAGSNCGLASCGAVTGGSCGCGR